MSPPHATPENAQWLAWSNKGDKIDNVEAKKLERWIRAAAVFLS